jgi:hypothetical protein
LKGQYDFRGRRWKRISDQAKSFIEDFLVLDPEERVDAQTAMSATWLNRRFAATTRGPDANEENMARHAMLRYAGYTKLKKMVRRHDLVDRHGWVGDVSVFHLSHLFLVGDRR